MLRHLCLALDFQLQTLPLLHHSDMQVFYRLSEILCPVQYCCVLHGPILEMLFHLKMHQGERLAQITPIQKVTTSQEYPLPLLNSVDEMALRLRICFFVFVLIGFFW